MSEAMSPAMSEMTGPLQIAARPDSVLTKAVFSYCCECGTYDAHTTSCTCCGFDFRVDALRDQT